MRRLASVAAAAALLGLPAPAAADHDKQYQWGEVEAPTYSNAMKTAPRSQFVDGPCTAAAAAAMPAGPEHDHLKPEQHAFSCRADAVFFDPWTEVLAARPDVVTGEMDVKGHLMAVAVSYPESGFILYDISDPAKPKFLSWYRGEECDGTLGDVDCGGYVDISHDLKRVYVSTQLSTVLTPPNAQMRPVPATPGIEVVSIEVPTLPVRIQKMPEVGNHTTRSFVVPESGGPGPREPGEYTVSISTPGLALNRVTPAGLLVPMLDIELNEAHDTFIQDDPILGRTLLYVAGGFDTGFYVYDITAPSSPQLLAEWDLTPECGGDWYSHTIDVAVRGGRRYVTMPTEAFDFFGEMGDEENCGRFVGMGDYAAPMWIVDATDLGRLGPADPAGNGKEDPALKGASEATLVATWSNPARRAAGELTFSPHNQQVVGDKIYLSQYHGGLVVLDASAAFRGERVRPAEVALHVPHTGPTRPIHPDRASSHFTTGFIDYRPLIWDMTYANGHVFVPDMTGGLTVVRETGGPPFTAAPSPTGQPCDDRLAPLPRVVRASLTSRGIRASGTATDRGCGKVANVSVALARLSGKRCRFLSTGGRLTAARSCRKPILLKASGTDRWSYSLRKKLPRGRYVVMVRATDTAGNRSRLIRKRARAR